MDGIGQMSRLNAHCLPIVKVQFWQSEYITFKQCLLSPECSSNVMYRINCSGKDLKQSKADLQMMNNQELCFNYEKIMML